MESPNKKFVAKVEKSFGESMSSELIKIKHMI